MRTDRLWEDMSRAMPWLLATVAVSLLTYFAFIRGTDVSLGLAIWLSGMFGAVSVAVAVAVLDLAGVAQQRYFTKDEGDTGDE